MSIGPTVTWEDLRAAFLETPVGESLKPAREQLDQLLLRGQVFLLIDGLDEIAPSSRRAVRLALWEFWGKYPNCRCIMTSRVIGYETVQFDWGLAGSCFIPRQLLSEINQTIDDFHAQNESTRIEKVDDPRPSTETYNLANPFLAALGRVRDWLENSPQSKKVVFLTERVPSKRQARLQANQAQHLYLAVNLDVHKAFVTPFDDEQLAQFARNWYTARETSR
jgi:hypothetical protein